jgi:succinate-acetate transporter protein
VRGWITLQVTFSIVSQVWAFVILKCCFVLVCVFDLSWGETLPDVGGVGGIPVQMCTEVEYGTLLNKEME